MSCFGSTPYFSRTAASSMLTVTLRPIWVEASSTRVAGATSCSESRSPVAMTHSSPSAAQSAARVPKMSSASKPSAVTIW